VRAFASSSITKAPTLRRSNSLKKGSGVVPRARLAAVAACAARELATAARVQDVRRLFQPAAIRVRLRAAEELAPRRALGPPVRVPLAAAG
jgi:hypothetical protein